MRRALLVFLLLLPLHAARGEPLWRTLPPTPAPVPGEYTGRAARYGHPRAQPHSQYLPK